MHQTQSLGLYLKSKTVSRFQASTCGFENGDISPTLTQSIARIISKKTDFLTHFCLASLNVVFKKNPLNSFTAYNTRKLEENEH